MYDFFKSLFNLIDIFIQSGHWTLDNLTTNDKMLEYLGKLFLEREISSFDAKDNRIMCFPHTVNIAVQHVLSKMSSVKAPENNDDNFEDMTDVANPDEGRGFGQTFEAACAQNPISRLRKIVTAIQGSGQCREALKTWIENGNRNGSFVMQNTPVDIEPMQLLRDVRTRWDSTYQMIKRCIEMRLVSHTLHLDDYTSYTIYFRPSIPSWHDQEVISSI